MKKAITSACIWWIAKDKKRGISVCKSCRKKKDIEMPGNQEIFFFFYK